MPKRYNNYRFYAFVALNFIAADLDVSLAQPKLGRVLDEVLDNQPGKSKSSIMYEIRSNHSMTNKVLDYLVDEDLILIERRGKEYRIKITRMGVHYLREYSRFYSELFKSEIAELYRYGQTPTWARTTRRKERD